MAITRSMSLRQHIEMSRHALHFFAPLQNQDMRALLALPSPEGDGATIWPLRVMDFMKYLEEVAGWDSPWDHAQEIERSVSRLALHGLLTSVGQTGIPSFGDLYYAMSGVDRGQAAGNLWLAPVLGPQLIVNQVQASLVHLLGVDGNGDMCGGTGLAVSERHIITARHVLEGMQLNAAQSMPSPRAGSPSQVVEIAHTVGHARHDLAIITVADTSHPLTPVAGLEMRGPTWADSVVLLGYPVVPRAGETPMTVQAGEVVNPAVRTYQNEELFLYSAIARPGNSGGPVIGSDGRLIGLVTQELYEVPKEAGSWSPAPFYAGLPAAVVQESLLELGHSDLLQHRDSQA